jgi:hypothetical protein
MTSGSGGGGPVGRKNPNAVTRLLCSLWTWRGWQWPETWVALAAAGLGLLLLPTDIGSLRFGMSADTRSSVAAGAFTSAVVAAVLASFEHRRDVERKRERDESRSLTVALADEAVRRLMIAAVDILHSSVVECVKWSRQQASDVADRDATELQLLASTLRGYAWALRTRDLVAMSRDNLRDGVLLAEFAGEVIAEAQDEAADHIELIASRLLQQVATTSLQVRQLVTALLGTQAADHAEPVVVLASELDKCASVSETARRWPVELVRVLTGWALVEPSDDPSVPREPLTERTPELWRDPLADRAFEHDDFTWVEDPSQRRRWLEPRRMQLTGVNQLPRSERPRATMARAAGEDEEPGDASNDESPPPSADPSP